MNYVVCLYQKKNQLLFRFSGFPNSQDNAKNDPVIRDIVTDSITVSNPKNFNDPMDPLLKVWLNIKQKRSYKKYDAKIFKMFKNICGQIRISCLSNYDVLSNIKDKSPLMWSHYAKNHTGICIQYEISPETIKLYNNDNSVMRLQTVRYRKCKAMSDYITIDNSLLAKGDCWNYEKETRLIYFPKQLPQDKDGKKLDYISLSGFKVKSVIMGCRISNKHESLITEICSSRNIPLYKMEFDYNDITRLIAHRQTL